ncbi:YSIRK-type signal peptide-containing protein, partial [Lactobacillus kitasatonis]
MMKRLKFLETKRTPRYSLRKLNVGVASVLLGVTIFGINFTNHSVKAATTESVENSNSSANSNSQQTSAAALTTAEQTKGINAIGAVKVPDSQNDANKAIDAALNKKNSEINGATNIDQTTKDKLNQAATDAADKAKEAITKATTNNDVATEQTNTQKAASATGKVQQSSASNNATANNSTEAAQTSSTKAKQTTQTATKNSDNTKVSSNTTNKENSQPTDKTTNTQVASNIDKTLASLLTKLLATASTTDDSASDSSTLPKSDLPKSDQTVTKVTDPMMEDYKNRGGKNTWIDQTVASGAYDYPGDAENAIFGDKGIIKQKQNSDKYFFAGYADFSEGYHRIILFARGKNASDPNLYTYVVHTHSDKVQPQTETPNETAPEIVYRGVFGFGGSTYNLQVHNYNGESFSVVLKGFKYDGQGGYGLTPIFDQGILNPKYKDKTEKQLDDTSGINYKEQIGRWDSVIPQETSTKVRYVDQATGKDILQPMEISGFGYQGFKINGNAPKIDGYTLVSSPKTLGLSYEDGIIAPYKVGKTYTQYFTDDVYVKQTVIDTNGTVRATAYYKGQPLGASASKILGHDDNNDSMSFTAGGQSYTYNNRINDVDGAMVYYYQKVGEEGKSQLRVHYIDVTKDTDDSQYAPGDGVPATDPISGQKMNPLTYTGNIGKTTYDYATNAKIPEGYVLVGTSPNIKGTFSKSDHDAYIYVKIDRNGAKDTIENLTYLNHAQKQAAEAAIDQATDLNTMNQAKQDASTLDRAMGTLKQAITNGEATHGTVAYDEADLDKKSTLDNAIKNGQAVTDATNGSNADLTTVKDLSQAIENAQTGLNGNSNLAKAKDQADQNIA